MQPQRQGARTSGATGVDSGSDASEKLQEKIRTPVSEYMKGEFVWKRRRGSFQQRQRPSLRARSDIKLDPEEAEYLKEGRSAEGGARDVGRALGL
jgi:hypothetical protein